MRFFCLEGVRYRVHGFAELAFRSDLLSSEIPTLLKFEQGVADARFSVHEQRGYSFD